MMAITCMVVCPGTIGEVQTVGELTDEHLSKAKDVMLSSTFKDNFRNMCQMDVIPDINIT